MTTSSSGAKASRASRADAGLDAGVALRRAADGWARQRGRQVCAAGATYLPERCVDPSTAARARVARATAARVRRAELRTVLATLEALRAKLRPAAALAAATLAGLGPAQPARSPQDRADQARATQAGTEFVLFAFERMISPANRAAHASPTARYRAVVQEWRGPAVNTRVAQLAVFTYLLAHLRALR
jgi:hypothetical protein